MLGLVINGPTYTLQIQHTAIYNWKVGLRPATIIIFNKLLVSSQSAGKQTSSTHIFPPGVAHCRDAQRCLGLRHNYFAYGSYTKSTVANLRTISETLQLDTKINGFAPFCRNARVHSCEYACPLTAFEKSITIKTLCVAKCPAGRRNLR